MSKIKFKCSNCGKDGERFASQVAKSGVIFCSKACHTLHAKGTGLGENNHNFGKRWGQELRDKQAQRMREVLLADSVRFEKFTSTNRGVKFSQERIDKMCANRIPREKGLFKHSEESKRKVGVASSKKFTLEYLAKRRLQGEQTGRITPLSQKEDREIYFALSNWIERMFDRIGGEELQLLKRHGVMSRANGSGVVRDHKLSRKTGMKLAVFPELLRHPCNCEIITNQTNITKAAKSPDSLSLDDLFDKVVEYDGEWAEQMVCLDLVKRYRNGERYQRAVYEQYYIECRNAGKYKYVKKC